MCSYSVKRAKLSKVHILYDIGVTYCRDMLYSVHSKLSLVVTLTCTQRAIAIAMCQINLMKTADLINDRGKISMLFWRTDHQGSMAY